MHLKSLNIVGFKTFADETEILFDPGFTAVVGPNGCGKSNIVDSVKWVFGEKSAKGLRGEKMDDVIFHGSEARKAAGFAEVSILFDNSDRFFSVDFPNFKITRRLYPDGENEYFINDTKVTRKEVEKTLLDTGIGKSSYSIMEQGKVDQLLNSKPEERRAIFEEAAGISRFKMERKEALKKLEDTQKNLQRIQDILHGMQKEMETKEKQSEKAEIYFKLKNEMNEADKNIRFLKIQDFRSRLSKYESELTEIKEKNQNLLSLISNETSQMEGLEERKSGVERDIVDIDKKLMDHLSKTQVQKEKISKNKQIIQDYEIRIQESWESEKKESDALARCQSELLQIQAQAEQILLDLNQLRLSLDSVSKERSDLYSELEFETESIRERNEKLLENERKNSKLREETRDVVLELVQLLEARKKDAQGKEEERLELRRNLLSSLDTFITDLELAKETLGIGETAAIREVLEKVDLFQFQSDLQVYMDLDDHFRAMFLEKDGILSKKEDLDRRMEDLLLENEDLTRANRNSQEHIEALRAKIEEKSQSIVEFEKRILEVQARETSLAENKALLQERADELDGRLRTIRDSVQSIIEKKSEFENEVEVLEREIEEEYQNFLAMSKALESQKEELNKILQDMKDLKSNIARNQEVFQGLFPILTEKEKHCSALRVQIESLTEELYNDYSMTEQELLDERQALTLKKSEEENKLRNAKFEIQQLGSINPLAIEEYRNTREIYEHHKAQKEDIEKSKNDIEEVLDGINQESEVLFRETFEKIKENFQETFSTLFRGGRATLELTEKEDSLNSGIEIMAEPPGKHVQNLRLLSGGEKSLTAVALMFAIYMVKPSPFCFLDEIDAALDEANKLRFCSILDKFKDKTQFVVISHAQSTISRANAIFGVTNEEPGISKLVSLKLDQAKTFAETPRISAAS
jgi:chromosome segregation protein